MPMNIHQKWIAFWKKLNQPLFLDNNENNSNNNSNTDNKIDIKNNYSIAANKEKTTFSVGAISRQKILQDNCYMLDFNTQVSLHKWVWQIKHLFLLNTHPSNCYHKLEFSVPLTHFQVQWSLWSLPEIKSFEEFFSLKLLYAHIQMLTVLLRSQLLFPEDAGLQMPRCFWNGCYLWVKKKRLL